MKLSLATLALLISFSMPQAYAYDDYEDSTGYCESPCYEDSMGRCTCPKRNSSGVRG